MKTLARPMTAIIAVVIAFSGLVAGAPARLPLAAAAEGNAVTDWSLIAQNAWSVGRPGTSGMYVAALVHAAIYDAVVAIDGGGEPFISSPTGDGANPDAAVAAAARDILVARVPSQAGSVQDQYTAYLAAIQDGPAKANGTAAGPAAAAAVLANREGDG
ncbi:MAG TPA: PA-phosphatase, partial [Candidatus Limnocylindria bacterium]|nr:PA-phosphatase [Candidatus Limnocylindria bacterium]